VINANSQTIGKTVITSQPLNNFYQAFSSTLQKKPQEPSTSSTPKGIPVNKCFVVTPAIPHKPLMQVTSSLPRTITSMPATTTFLTFKPAIQNQSSVANSSLHRAEGSTIVVGNKQYQLVKGPSGQMKAVVNTPKIFMKSPPVVPTKVCKIHQYIMFKTFTKA